MAAADCAKEIVTAMPIVEEAAAQEELNKAIKACSEVQSELAAANEAVAATGDEGNEEAKSKDEKLCSHNPGRFKKQSINDVSVVPLRFNLGTIGIFNFRHQVC